MATYYPQYSTKGISVYWCIVYLIYNGTRVPVSSLQHYARARMKKAPNSIAQHTNIQEEEEAEKAKISIYVFVSVCARVCVVYTV